MKRRLQWAILPTVLTALVAIAPAVQSQPVQTPLRTPVVVSGTAGGPQSSSCGFVPRTPNQVVQVTEPFTSLRFKVQGNGQLTLLISGPGGRNQCVMAVDGNIEAPGVWERGTYSLFVGDRSQAGGSRFTLTVSQE